MLQLTHYPHLCIRTYMRHKHTYVAICVCVEQNVTNIITIKALLQVS